MMKSEIETDILVAGGGLAGCFAAIAAKRTDPDQEVWLVERYGFFGGMATAGYVYPFMRYFARDPQNKKNKRLTGGLFQEMLDTMHDRGYTEIKASVKDFYQRFDPMMLRCVLDDMVTKAGVNLLFHGLINEVETTTSAGGTRRVISCTVQTKMGGIKIQPRIVVDATGDGDIVFHSGGDYEQGRTEDGLGQPATLNFRLGNIDCEEEVDDEAAQQWIVPFDRATIGRLIKEEKEKGNPLTPRDDCLMFLGNRPSERHLNQTRVTATDFTDPFELTAAELEGRRQAERFVQFLRAKVPNYENCSVMALGTQIGIRESRRIKGWYTLTGDDLFAGRLFPDRIALGNYSIDIHDPRGSAKTEIHNFPPGHFYSIPFRCLVPKTLSNVIVAGRPISATHEAHSAIRIMPICSAIGHAAGVGAALVAQKEKLLSFNTVNIEHLRAVLRAQGAILD